MERICFVFELHPGAAEEYERRHDEIWVEELLLLEEAGISDYSIFLDGTKLYAVLKVEPGWENAVEIIGGSEVQARWAAYMDDLIAWQIDENGEFHMAREVFRFDGKAPLPAVEAKAGAALRGVTEAFADLPNEAQQKASRITMLTGADHRLLAETVAVVTGGTGAIGKSLVSTLADAGANVVVADCDNDEAGALADALTDAGGRVVPFQMDVTSPTDVVALGEFVRATFGRVDVLVNNAGVIHADPLLELPFEEWERVFDVNVNGTFLVTRELARIMVDQDLHPDLGRRGLIACISSLAAEIGRPVSAAYGASKAAVNHFAKTCAVTLGADDVATLVVYPGTVQEGMWQAIAPRIAEIEGDSVDTLEAQRTFQPAEELAQIVTDAIATTAMHLNGQLIQWTRDVGPL